MDGRAESGCGGTETGLIVLTHIRTLPLLDLCFILGVIV